MKFTRILHADFCGLGVLEQWIVHGAGHAWSGEVPRVPPQNRGGRMRRGRCRASFSITHTLGVDDLAGATAALADKASSLHRRPAGSGKAALIGINEGAPFAQAASARPPLSYYVCFGVQF
jgi:hypothetical protein